MRYKVRISSKPGEADLVVAYSTSRRGEKVRTVHARANVTESTEADAVVRKQNLLDVLAELEGLLQ